MAAVATSKTSADGFAFDGFNGRHEGGDFGRVGVCLWFGRENDRLVIPQVRVRDLTANHGFGVEPSALVFREHDDKGRKVKVFPPSGQF